jgi:hypothetical protein
MMLFLIDYDRNAGLIRGFERFPAGQRRDAEAARLKLELSHRQSGLDREVVLLEAASEADLRISHRRYFEDVESLIDAPIGKS